MSPSKQKETICALWALCDGDDDDDDGDTNADDDGNDDDGDSWCIVSDYAWAGLQRAKGSEIIVSDE